LVLFLGIFFVFPFVVFRGGFHGGVDTESFVVVFVVVMLVVAGADFW
jgi:hypothetical protein